MRAETKAPRSEEPKAGSLRAITEIVNAFLALGVSHGTVTSDLMFVAAALASKRGATEAQFIAAATLVWCRLQEAIANPSSAPAEPPKGTT